jgi:OmcA/MtrC family decaheme c-type cytochrome
MICTVCHSSSLGGTFDTDAFGPLALGAFLHGLHAGNVSAIGAITYPQSLARCEGCHVAGKFNTARTSALPITVDAGTTVTSGAETLHWTDDLADSATAGTCKGCHTSVEAAAHMTQQGGSFGAAKSLTPSSSVEGCPVCHGAGQTFDTKVEHCKGLTYGACTP